MKKCKCLVLVLTVNIHSIAHLRLHGLATNINYIKTIPICLCGLLFRSAKLRHVKVNVRIDLTASHSLPVKQAGYMHVEIFQKNKSISGPGPGIF